MQRSIGCIAMTAMLLMAPAALAAGVPPGDCVAHSKKLLDAMVDGDYATARANFSAEMKAAASADLLKQVWAGIQAGSGALKGRGEPRQVASEMGSVVFTPLQFSGTPRVFEVSCSNEGEVDGIHFLSPQEAGGIEGELAGAVAKPARAPIVAHVAADGVRVQPLDVPSPLGPLHGALTLPAGKGPFPAVVLVQGSGSSDMDETIGPNKPFRDIADGLAKAGVASLRYDKRAFVYPRQVAADAKFTVDAEVTGDALAAAQLLAKQQQVDPRRMFVLGLSEGGMLAPRIGQRDPRLAGIIMLAAPARQLLEVSAEQVRELAAKHGEPKAAVDANLEAIAAERQLLDKAGPQHPPAGSFRGAPQSWWLSLHDYDQVAAAKALSMPILILQGGSDFQVSPAKDYEAWKHALTGKPDVTFHLYPGLSHLFMPAGKTLTIADYAKPAHVDPSVIADIADWIKVQPAR